MRSQPQSFVLAAERTAVSQFSQAGLAAGMRLVPASGAAVADYIETLKPRVMSLVVFTGIVGMALAPGHLNPVQALVAVLCIAVGAGAAGAINMWYERYRRANAPHRPAASADRADGAGRGARLGRRARGRRRARHDPGVELAGGGAARSDHWLLRLRLHDLAEAADAAEHRHWWCRGRRSAGDRLGGGDRRHRLGGGGAIRHRVLMDAAAFLGIIALSDRRLRSGARTDAARSRRYGSDQATDFLLLPVAVAGLFRALHAGYGGRALWRRRRPAQSRVHRFGHSPLGPRR